MSYFYRVRVIEAGLPVAGGTRPPLEKSLHRVTDAGIDRMVPFRLPPFGLGREAVGWFLQSHLHPEHHQGRIAGSERGHDRVPPHLLHRPLIAMDLLHHPLLDGLEVRSCVLRIPLSEHVEPFQIRIEHRDLFALAAQGTPRGHDLIDQVCRGIARGS
jgi:hypothetical protein